MVEQEDMSSNKRSKTQHRMVAGVSVAISDDGTGDWDELLRESLRVGLRIDTNPACDDFDELYARIKELINAYIDSPEGADAPASMLMCRLAACISDVIPMEERKRRWSRAN